MRFLSILLLAGAAMAQGPAYHEVANNRQVMQGLIQPAQQAINTATKETGPADDRAWRGVSLNAVILQESAQLLKTTGRAKDQDAWIKDADALGAAGAAVQKAADAKDFAALQTAATGITATCQGCHSVYRQRGGGQQKKQ
jgi:cytochrome c556